MNPIRGAGPPGHGLCVKCRSTLGPKACIYTFMSDLSARELELCAKVSTLCVCNQLRRTAREITQRYDDALAESGVAVTQLPILVALGSKGDLPMTILAGKLSLDRTTLTRNLRILEIRGLVQIVAHEEDARVHLASLTSAGARVLGEARSARSGCCT
jgi:DNA-binding MarR family transcriptional regulator